MTLEIGMFEVLGNTEDDRRTSASQAERQIQKAQKDVHSRYLAFLKNASTSAEFRERYAHVKTDIFDVVKAHTAPLPKVMRQIEASLKREVLGSTPNPQAVNLAHKHGCTECGWEQRQAQQTPAQCTVCQQGGGCPKCQTRTASRSLNGTTSPVGSRTGTVRSGTSASRYTDSGPSADGRRRQRTRGTTSSKATSSAGSSSLISRHAAHLTRRDFTVTAHSGRSGRPTQDDGFTLLNPGEGDNDGGCWDCDYEAGSQAELRDHAQDQHGRSLYQAGEGPNEPDYEEFYDGDTGSVMAPDDLGSRQGSRRAGSDGQPGGELRLRDTLQQATDVNDTLQDQAFDGDAGPGVVARRHRSMKSQAAGFGQGADPFTGDDETGNGQQVDQENESWQDNELACPQCGQTGLSFTEGEPTDTLHVECMNCQYTEDIPVQGGSNMAMSSFTRQEVMKVSARMAGRHQSPDEMFEGAPVDQVDDSNYGSESDTGGGKHAPGSGWTPTCPNCQYKFPDGEDELESHAVPGPWAEGEGYALECPSCGTVSDIDGESGNELHFSSLAAGRHQAPGESENDAYGTDTDFGGGKHAPTTGWTPTCPNCQYKFVDPGPNGEGDDSIYEQYSPDDAGNLECPACGTTVGNEDSEGPWGPVQEMHFSHFAVDPDIDGAESATRQSGLKHSLGNDAVGQGGAGYAGDEEQDPTAGGLNSSQFSNGDIANDSGSVPNPAESDGDTAAEEVDGFFDWLQVQGIDDADLTPGDPDTVKQFVAEYCQYAGIDDSDSLLDAILTDLSRTADDDNGIGGGSAPTADPSMAPQMGDNGAQQGPPPGAGQQAPDPNQQPQAGMRTPTSSRRKTAGGGIPVDEWAKTNPNAEDYSIHKDFVCKNHPESQFSSKHPYARSLFVKPGAEDCNCPISDLLYVGSEDEDRRTGPGSRSTEEIRQQQGGDALVTGPNSISDEDVRARGRQSRRRTAYNRPTDRWTFDSHLNCYTSAGENGSFTCPDCQTHFAKLGYNRCPEQCGKVWSSWSVRDIGPGKTAHGQLLFCREVQERPYLLHEASHRRVGWGKKPQAPAAPAGQNDPYGSSQPYNPWGSAPGGTFTAPGGASTAPQTDWAGMAEKGQQAQQANPGGKSMADLGFNHGVQGAPFLDKSHPVFNQNTSQPWHHQEYQQGYINGQDYQKKMIQPNLGGGQNNNQPGFSGFSNRSNMRRRADRYNQVAPWQPDGPNLMWGQDHPNSGGTVDYGGYLNDMAPQDLSTEDGNFCPHCGQNASHGEVNINDMSEPDQHGNIEVKCDGCGWEGVTNERTTPPSDRSQWSPDHYDPFAEAASRNPQYPGPEGRHNKDDLGGYGIGDSYCDNCGQEGVFTNKYGRCSNCGADEDSLDSQTHPYEDPNATPGRHRAAHLFGEGLYHAMAGTPRKRYRQPVAARTYLAGYREGLKRQGTVQAGHYTNGWRYARTAAPAPKTVSRQFLMGYTASLEFCKRAGIVLAYPSSGGDVGKAFEPKVKGVPNSRDDADPASTTEYVQDNRQYQDLKDATRRHFDKMNRDEDTRTETLGIDLPSEEARGGSNENSNLGWIGEGGTTPLS